MATKTRVRIPQTPFFDAIRKSGLITPDDLVEFIVRHDISEELSQDPLRLATFFVQNKMLTKFQALQLMRGNTQGFVLGPYKLQEGLRQDRVGMVFLAVDTRSEKQVALKVLPTDRTEDPTILKAFTAEVRLAAQVDHANVARVLDLGKHQGTHYVVSEYVPGPTLDFIIRRNPLTPDEAARHVARVAVALRYAHQHELLHRDIKPGNIALTEDGRVKLIDLGLTHMLENPWQQVTKRINTQEYAEEIDHVAPEQAWGCEQDVRGDIYSLGSTFYTLLTNQSPFPGDAATKMKARQLHGVPAPSLVKPDIPRQLDAIVQKMGCNHQHERYQTMDEVLADLHPWLPITEWLALGIGVPKPKLPERTEDASERKKSGFLQRLFKRG
jgi:serine/threonine-protein kinase